MKFYWDFIVIHFIVIFVILGPHFCRAVDYEPKMFKYILVLNSTTRPSSLLMSEQQVFENLNCPVKNCFVTHNVNYFHGGMAKFDAIVFSGQALPEHMRILRYSHQKYIYANMEPAEEYPICNPVYDGFFNWTATYRLDSDFVFSHITIKNSTGYIVGPKRSMNWIENMENVDEQISQKLQSKRKAAVWFVSRCNKKNYRNNFVEKLQNALKYYNLTVDIYGRCGKFKCRRLDCLRKINKDYYFYLALEPFLAEDYVTEKIVTALQNHIVPIVFGGADYSRFLPPGSYISGVKATPESLAKQMHKIIQSPDEYRDFFKWKRYYKYYATPTDSANYKGDAVCKLCEAINDEKEFTKPSIHNEIRKWWEPNFEAKCAQKYGVPMPQNHPNVVSTQNSSPPVSKTLSNVQAPPEEPTPEGPLPEGPLPQRPFEQPPLEGPLPSGPTFENPYPERPPLEGPLPDRPLPEGPMPEGPLPQRPFERPPLEPTFENPFPDGPSRSWAFPSLAAPTQTPSSQAPHALVPPAVRQIAPSHLATPNNFTFVRLPYPPIGLVNSVHDSPANPPAIPPKPYLNISPDRPDNSPVMSHNNYNSPANAPTIPRNDSPAISKGYDPAVPPHYSPAVSSDNSAASSPSLAFTVKQSPITFDNPAAFSAAFDFKHSYHFPKTNSPANYPGVSHSKVPAQPALNSPGRSEQSFSSGASQNFNSPAITPKFYSKPQKKSDTNIPVKSPVKPANHPGTTIASMTEFSELTDQLSLLALNHQIDQFFDDEYKKSAPVVKKRGPAGRKHNPLRQ